MAGGLEMGSCANGATMGIFAKKLAPAGRLAVTDETSELLRKNLVQPYPTLVGPTWIINGPRVRQLQGTLGASGGRIANARPLQLIAATGSPSGDVETSGREVSGR